MNDLGKRALRAGAPWCSARTYSLASFPFALWILVMLLVGGPEQKTHNSVIRLHLLFFTYSTGAYVAGAVIGLLLPAARRLWSAPVLGVVALLAWAVGTAVSIDRGYAHWTGAHTFTTAVHDRL